MIDKLIKLFNKKNKLPNLNRIYSVDYFLDKIHQQNFIENGYVVIKNSVEKSQISFLKNLFNIQHCVVENGGNFQIKPASKHSVLNPHQDSPIIDETTYYAVFIWIPLCDITLQNGPVWVLPKSHLWCNYQTRIAITTTALPKNYQLVEYFKDEKTPENKIEKYHVDQNYYINENINERPDDKFTFVGYENHIFNHITSSQIKELIKKHQP